MARHTQTIRWQQPTNCLSVFDHLMGLALKGLKLIYVIVFIFHITKLAVEQSVYYNKNVSSANVFFLLLVERIFVSLELRYFSRRQIYCDRFWWQESDFVWSYLLEIFPLVEDTSLNCQENWSLNRKSSKVRKTKDKRVVIGCSSYSPASIYLITENPIKSINCFIVMDEYLKTTFNHIGLCRHSMNL